MSEQCPNCKKAETRIDGFCSIYCRDVSEIGEETKRYKQALGSIVFEYEQDINEEKDYLEKLMYALAKEALKGDE